LKLIVTKVFLRHIDNLNIFKFSFTHA